MDDIKNNEYSATLTRISHGLWAIDTPIIYFILGQTGQ